MKVRNQTHQKEGKSPLRSQTEEGHRPDLRQVTPSRRPWTQKTRVTPPTVKQRRADNQGLSDNHTELSANTGSERKEPQQRVQENSRSLDHPTVGTIQRRPLQERVRQEAKATDAAPETPQELNTQEQQEGPQDCVQTTWPARAGEGQTETLEGGLTTKGSWHCKLRS